jgi:hypothetical protein
LTALLEEALNLDSRNIEISDLLGQLREERQRKAQLGVFLIQVDTARRNGDPAAALAAAQQALEIDKRNSQIIAICELLAREAEEATRRSTVDRLIVSARSELASSRFSEGLTTLQEIEVLDPDSPGLALLMSDAHAGLAREQRKLLAGQLRSESAAATTAEELRAVLISLETRLVECPDEADLILIMGQIERQIDQHEKRDYIEHTLEKCKALHPEAALKILEEANLRVPGDQRVLSLKSSLKARIASKAMGRRRAGLLASAQNAIAMGAYAEAINVMRGPGRLKIGRYPLPANEGTRLRRVLHANQPFQCCRTLRLHRAGTSFRHHRAHLQGGFSSRCL